MRHRVRPVVLLCAVAGTVALAACGAKTNSSSSTSGSSTAAKGGKQGGSLTVVLNSGYDGAWPAGLDPVTNTNGAANQSLMNSIYGQLIELHEGGKLVPGLASAFKFSNGGKTFTLTIRPGVKFSDGTPFTAQVVADHINKVLKSPCTCRPTWPVKSVTASGDDVVDRLHPVVRTGRGVVHRLQRQLGALADRDREDGRAQVPGQARSGAGPFTVVSNKLSSQIVLKKNPTYFKQGRPFLDQLTFKSIGGDEAAYQALQAGQAQAYENLSTPSLIDQMKKDPKLQVDPAALDLALQHPAQHERPAVQQPQGARRRSTTPRTPRRSAPSCSRTAIRARRASPGPGGLFFEADVPGYRTTDLEKAKALVKELGGLKTQLGTINVLVAKQTTQALRASGRRRGSRPRSSPMTSGR